MQKGTVMADIRPFKSVRPAARYVSRVAALPYDVYSRKEAYAEAAKDRLSFLNIDRPETQFPEETDMYAPEVYQKARELLTERIQGGIFLQDEQPAYYLYELTRNGHTQTGIVACASIDDYLNHTIKKHENTRADKEQDRICHVDACSAQTGPILMAYRKDERISRIVEREKRKTPVFAFASPDGVMHRGWRVSDGESICGIRTSFAEINQIYIADGHHRAASAVKVGLKRRSRHPEYDGSEEFNYFLSILFPDDELTILDYNRVVKDLNGLSKEEFLSKVREKFEMEQCPSAVKPEQKGTMTMYLEQEWFRLTVRDEYRSTDPVKGLDVSILQRELLGPVLGIEDPKMDERIGFIGGIRGLGELERRVDTDCAVAFALFPTSIEELFRVADAGLLMPPKSTWFEPKLRSGLFIHCFER